MKRIFCHGLIIAAFAVFCLPSSFAQQESIHNVDALFLSSKLKDPGAIRKAFEVENAACRVMVNLSRPEAFAHMVDRDKREKTMTNQWLQKSLKEAVKKRQEAVIGRTDPDQVRVSERFSFISGFVAQVTLEGLRELVELEEVVSVEKDKILQMHLAQGIPLMNASAARNTYSGSGIAIAICDTGIDYTHPMLGGGGFPNDKVIGGRDCGDNDNDPLDSYGHGTCCAGIAAGDIGTAGDYVGGVAYGAKLYAIKISPGNEAWAYASDMIEAWEWCIAHQYDDPTHPIMIISTSFGMGRYANVCDDVSSAMTQAAANAVAAGITLFVSSGNDGFCDSISWPACISHVASVGAVYDANFGIFRPCVSSQSCVPKEPTNQCETGYFATDITEADLVPAYSNTATHLDLLAPSDEAYTTDLTGPGGYARGDYEGAFGGTSAACPYAAGAAACLQEAAQAVTGSLLSPGQVKSKLISTGDLVTDGKAGITKPRLNLGLAIDMVDLPVLYIDGLVPTHGGYGSKISIVGSGFGSQRFGMIDSTNGYYGFVTLSGEPGTLIATKYPLWSDTKVNTKFTGLFIDLDQDHLQDGDEPFLTVDQLPQGIYWLAIHMVWFHDENWNGVYDGGEEIYQSASSDSRQFTLTDEPVIYCFRPDNTPEPGEVIKIKGLNFGETQGSSLVHIGPSAFDASSPRIKLWTDTKIKIRIPKYPCDWFGDLQYRYRKVWVTVDSADSNIKKVKVIRPSTCP